MVFGKILGSLIGYSAFGIAGAILGAIAGHFFDKGFGQAMGFDYSGDREKLQRLFFETSFKVMGHLAKADGRITEQEIAQTEVLMGRLGLNAEHRREAIAFFQEGSQQDFQLQPTIAEFISGGGRRGNLSALLLEFLISLALADNEVHPAEREVLSQTAGYLGIKARQFERLLQMLEAQKNFAGGFSGGGFGSGQQGGGYQQQAPRLDEVANAYRALGVSADDSDKDIKRAYRKLMSAYHPDKMIAQGVPEDMLKMATEKSQEIQAAYEIIKQAWK